MKLFNIKLTKKEILILLCVVLTSLFLNLYQIDKYIMFIGDFGRDYLAARDMLLTGNIPLVGIPSSVTWLHQGPLSIYIIALSLIIGNFNPIAPAITFAIIGIFTSVLIYFLGKSYGNKKIGAFAALFFATSPLFVVSSRMPYHTSSIPFFASLFFLILAKVIKGKKKLLPLLFFILGVLLLLELSNAVIFALLFVLLVVKRPKIERGDVLVSFFSFCLGILPFIIYDITHNFTQTVGFPLWIINRVRIFFLGAVGISSIKIEGGNVFLTIFQQLGSAIFPSSAMIALVFIVAILIISFKSLKTFLLDKKDSNKILIPSLWLLVPLFGYLVHKTPGTAYFPLLFPAIAIFMGYIFEKLTIFFKPAIFLVIIAIFINARSIIVNDYYLTTKNGKHGLPPQGYTFGHSIELLNEVADFIKTDSKNKPFSIKVGGFGSRFKSSDNNYKYLLYYRGVKVVDNAKLMYIIYENKNDVLDFNKVVYSNNYIYVTKTIFK